MTAEETEALHTFQTRVRQMILQYKSRENQIASLSAIVQQQKEALTKLAVENESLRKEYANLKMAKMIDITDADLGGAKQRLSKLVREVDKCIALLNV